MTPRRRVKGTNTPHGACLTCGAVAGRRTFCPRCLERGRAVMSLQNRGRSLREALDDDMHPLAEFHRRELEARLSVIEEQLAVLRRDDAHLAAVLDDEVRPNPRAIKGERPRKGLTLTTKSEGIDPLEVPMFNRAGPN